MPIPAFDASGVLPEGRHRCTLDEIEQALVDHPRFAGSTRRRKIFGDFRSAEALLDTFHADLIERIWIGGGFASAAENPDDLDATFILSEVHYMGLSKTSQARIRKLCRRGGFKAAGELDVDGFFFVHERIANPWKGQWLKDSAITYSASRGAWDDWWSRRRIHGAKDQEPLVEDSDTVRGYLEVVR